MSHDFKSVPTLSDLAARINKLVHDLLSLNAAVGHQFGQMEATLQENNALTDGAIEELNLKIAFLMTILQVKRPLNSGIADVNGNVPFENVSALEIYLKGGRQQILDKREAAQKAFLDAQDLQATSAPGGDENAATGSGAAPDGDSHDSGPTFKLITH